MSISNVLREADLLKQLADCKVEYEKCKLKLEIHLQTSHNVQSDKEIRYLSKTMKEFMVEILTIEWKLQNKIKINM